MNNIKGICKLNTYKVNNNSFMFNCCISFINLFNIHLLNIILTSNNYIIL